MAKKKKKEQLNNEVDNFINDINEDRERLTQFIDKLLQEHSDQPAGIAEYIAKLMDASTKQLQTRASMIKAIAKETDTDADEASEMNDIAKEIGMPFSDITEKDDSN